MLRVAGRFGLATVGCVVAALIAVQYGRIVQQNLSYARQIHDVERDIGDLQRHRDEQLREIGRLSDPKGAIPEIHDRLHLVGDHEAIIYLKRHDGADAD